MSKKLMVVLILGVFILSLFTIAAKNTQVVTKLGDKMSIVEMHKAQNQFENNFKFNCTGECIYTQTNNNLNLELKEQKKFWFMNVEAKRNYVINEDGELLRKRSNIWARVFNTDKALQ